MLNIPHIFYFNYTSALVKHILLGNSGMLSSVGLFK